MSTLNFEITNAGRQAAIDADNLGIKLTITHVAYGTGNWSPDKTATALQSEFKRLVAGGCENPAPLYVHIAVTDQSSDAYQANEVGIYAGDVLFGIWSKGLQSELDGPGKINTGDSAFVFDLLLENVPPDSVTVGDANFSNPLSTEKKAGVITTASQDEIEAFTGNGAIIPPKFKIWWDKVFVKFKTAAFLDAGQDDGQVALIGDLSENGRTAVLVNQGHNGNGTFNIYSNGYAELFITKGTTATGLGSYDVSYPVTLSSVISNNISIMSTSSPENVGVYSCNSYNSYSTIYFANKLKDYGVISLTVRGYI